MNAANAVVMAFMKVPVTAMETLILVVAVVKRVLPAVIMPVDLP